jgi:hypothetical protein
VLELNRLKLVQKEPPETGVVSSKPGSVCSRLTDGLGGVKRTGWQLDLTRSMRQLNRTPRKHDIAQRATGLFPLSQSFTEQDRRKEEACPGFGFSRKLRYLS